MSVPQRHNPVDLRFSGVAWEDYQHWLATVRSVLRRLNAVIKDARRSPFEGIGKPEPLKGDRSGWRARRITDGHQLVFRVVGADGTQVLEIAAFAAFTIRPAAFPRSPVISTAA